MLPPGRVTADERRRRQIARHADRHPGTVNLADVAHRLSDELPARHVDFVLEEVGRRRIDAVTLWSWLGRFGAESLVHVLASDGGHAGLLRRLASDAPLDRAELDLLAHLTRPALFVEAAFAADQGLAV